MKAAVCRPGGPPVRPLAPEEAHGVRHGIRGHGLGSYTALYFLRKAGVRAGQNVLVYGASGSVGVFAVQLAKHFGARVTGVCSTANVEMVKSLGVDAVVDYTKEDFSQTGRVYDVVCDTLGKSGFSRSLRALKRGGTYVRIAMSDGVSSLFRYADARHKKGHVVVLVQ